MWILFALTSATILASRKIQEKKLVDIFGQSLGWMIRTGSALTVIFIWLLLSRETYGIDSYQVWIVVGIIALIMYPLQTYTYFRSMRDMPLSVFGLLAPVTFLSSILFSFFILGTRPSSLGILGVVSVSLGAIMLIPRAKKKSHIHIPVSAFLIAMLSYMLMGLGSVLDKIAMAHTSVYLYAMLNQTFSAISMILLIKYFFKDLKWEKAKATKFPIILLGILTGLAWMAGIYAIQISPNVGYAVALINTHALFTTIYGISVLKEHLTKEKILAFIFMLLALVAFAFA